MNIKTLKFLLAGIAVGTLSFSANAATITFQQMPAGVPGHPETLGTASNDCIPGSCYVEQGFAIGPISVPGTDLEHVHGESVDGPGDKELNYHADAGGWRLQSATVGQKINLASWTQVTIGDVDVNDETGSAPKDFLGDLIVEAVGGANNGFKKNISQSTAANSIITFGSEFSGIDAFLVYFDGNKGVMPVANSAEDGFFSGIDDVNVTNASAIPVPAAVYLFGSALIGLVGFGRRNNA